MLSRPDSLFHAMDFAKGFNKDRNLIGIYKNKLHGDAARLLVEKDLEHLKLL